MSAIVPIPLVPPPGVVVTDSLRAAEGRWTTPFDKIRFVKGRPEKIGGNRRLTTTAMSGTPRASHAWRDFSQNQYFAAGTFRKLYAFDSTWATSDITPIQASGALGANPFATVNGSTTVTVSHTAHGRSTGDVVIFAGALLFNNVTMNGTFLVTSVTSANAYTVTALTTANATSSGGGAGVTYQYEITTGTDAGSSGQGWGVGNWGEGTWGDPHSGAAVAIEPRVWSLSNMGKILLGTYNGGTLWSFDPTQGQPWPRAVGTFGGVTMNAPTDFRAMFVTPERFVFGLCDQMVVKVCSQGDPTTWTPASTNTAFQRTLQEGTKLVGGAALGPFISMVWTDSAAYLFQYTGSQFVYNSSLVGKDCGLISPNARVTVDGVAYWMGADNFYTYRGTVAPMPNVEDIRKYVFENVPSELQYQCSAIYIPKYHEIWFFYPTTGSTDPTSYIIYSITQQCWAPGSGNFYSSASVTAARASGSHHTAGDTSPLMAGTDGHVYNHDPVDDTHNDNATPMTWTLTMAPIAQAEGVQHLDVEGMLWDFFEQSGSIQATVNGYDRLTDAAPTDTQTQTVPDTLAGMTDYRLSGRYLGFSLTQRVLNGYFRWGKPVAHVRPSGRRR